jgi:hypothetical protein
MKYEKHFCYVVITLRKINFCFKINFKKMLVNKTERCLTQNFSNRQLDALRKNHYEIKMLDNTFKKYEQEFEKNNSKIRKSINCTIQSFQLIKSSNLEIFFKHYLNTFRNHFRVLLDFLDLDGSFQYNSITK